MGYDKGHKEFYGVDMKEGFHTVPGYPWGFSEKILAGSLDEKNKVGNRTRILKIEPGAFSTVPFVHEYWEEVFLVSGDLVCGSDAQGRGGGLVPLSNIKHNILLAQQFMSELSTEVFRAERRTVYA